MTISHGRPRDCRRLRRLTPLSLSLPLPLPLFPSTPPTTRPRHPTQKTHASPHSTGTFWATSVVGVLAYQWSKPIPTNLKIIHARVAAQALTLGALAAAAAVDFYEHKSELERVGARLNEVEKKVIVESGK